MSGYTIRPGAVDWLGQTYEPGDEVVYAGSSNHTPFFVAARVVEIREYVTNTQMTLKVHLVPTGKTSQGMRYGRLSERREPRPVTVFACHVMKAP